ncbi:MAG: DEAD/DEAH box helicase [Spiroplasmataceae bacterium]|jgi:ATP-dependent RNA helicase DeaD|nr:DEAD/DEAH box helicase [Spiroplasmataceae bacterium]
MNLEHILLSDRTKENLRRIGYQKLTDIQSQTIPLALEGRNIIAQSQTGTGKTAAFLIPILENLKSTKKPQVLVLVPTRELALQVSEEARKFSSQGDLKVAAIYGGEPIFKQLQAFRRGVDIVIGTPGRIIDHLFVRKTFNPTQLKFVVLDEVDEMIGKGFLEDIKKIMKKIPENRQTLLFSATISPEVDNFAKIFVKDPAFITSKTDELPSKIEHYYLETPSLRQKNSSLAHFLSSENELGSVIIFANTKRKVEEINDTLLDNDLRVDYIHSDLTQSRRTRVFQKFRSKKISLLIATDVAARGLDIKDITYVINYDFPQNREFYIHRTGRTGRAGASGKAITFINSPQEKRQLLAIARQKGFKLERFAR